MTSQQFLQRLLDFERRVGTLYQSLGNRPAFHGELRAFWHRMAEDERHHVFILQRSKMIMDLQESVPVGSDDVFRAIEQQLTTAEAALGQIDISADEALRHALILEGSELNRLDGAWFHCFPPALRALLTALMPEDNLHLRRLLETVHAFSSNKELHEQATTLWVKYQRAKTNPMSVDGKTDSQHSKTQS